MYNKSALIILSALALGGCGNDSKTETNPILNENGVPQLNEMKLSLKPLKKSINKSFENHYKNGIYLSAMKDDGIRYLFETAMPTADDSSTTKAEFSTTITQESGVDEADRIKYDGDYLYIANNATYYRTLGGAADSTATDASTPEGSHIRVLKKNTDNSMSSVFNIEIDEEGSNRSIDGLYLADDILSVLSSNYTMWTFAYDAAFDIWHPGPQQFNVGVYDTKTPSAIARNAEFKVDGYVISSRRIDNNLVVVSSYSPSVKGLEYYPQTEEAKANNYKLIQDTDIADLLPTYTVDGGEAKPLVTAENCFIPEDATTKDGYDGIVTLTTINLENPEQVTSVCINGASQGIYATPSSVYLYGSLDYEQSVIHKFGLNGQTFDYQASADFAGHVFGRGESSLRFSEQGDYLRVVTTQSIDSKEDRFDHHLKVFKADTASKTLNVVAELPNAQQPDKLGKDNEDIFAVRYYGKKAFIVTFENTDPLYVLNMADNTKPYVESALEIVGYSSYLHPISEDYILGIGQNVAPRSSGDGTSSEPTVAIVEGAKVALFDVSSNAKLVKEFVFEGGYTPAEYDYHALTYLQKDDNKHWFAMPIESWSSTKGDEGYDVWTSDIRLQLFEVNLTGSDGTIENTGSVAPAFAKDDYSGSWQDRAIIHGDLIYYVHGSQVWQSVWQTPKLINGPY